MSVFTQRNSQCLAGRGGCTTPLSLLLRTSRRKILAPSKGHILGIITSLTRRTRKHCKRLAPGKTRRRQRLVSQVFRHCPRIFDSNARISTHSACGAHTFLSVTTKYIRLGNLGPGLGIAARADRTSTCCVGCGGPLCRTRRLRGISSICHTTSDICMRPRQLVGRVFHSSICIRGRISTIGLVVSLFRLRNVDRDDCGRPSLSFLFAPRRRCSL